MKNNFGTEDRTLAEAIALIIVALCLIFAQYVIATALVRWLWIIIVTPLFGIPVAGFWITFVVIMAISFILGRIFPRRK